MINFIKESNRIDGINRAPNNVEIRAHEDFMGLDSLGVADVCNFVKQVANAQLRDDPILPQIYIARHTPPKAGPEIKEELADILFEISNGLISPYQAHHLYESLHPFMDGNGRSGRVIWLWHMRRDLSADAMHIILACGFLHSFYYQCLAEGRK